MLTNLSFGAWHIDENLRRKVRVRECLDLLVWAYLGSGLKYDDVVGFSVSSSIKKLFIEIGMGCIFCGKLMSYSEKGTANSVIFHGLLEHCCSSVEAVRSK